MAVRTGSERKQNGTPTVKNLGTAVFKDLQKGGLSRTLRRDMEELYEFYLDEASRERLRNMGRLRRWLSIAVWLVKNLIMRLPPARRLLLLGAFLLLFFNDVSIDTGRVNLTLSMSIFSFAIVLVILMLELKDKLLARDELEAGRAVQLALLPRDNPLLAGWETWLFTRPANDVGGDLVDYLSLPPDGLGLTLGDVSGKGLPAALLMAKLQSTLRALAPECTGLAELGRRVNQILCRDGVPGKFATLLYLRVAPGDGAVRLLNAGHMPPLVLHEGRVHTLPPVAKPLGILPDAEFVEQRMELAQGDLLVAYSDGLSEARSPRGEFFGEERLTALLPGLSGLTAEEAGRRILEEEAAFSGDGHPFDDLSLVVLRRVV